MGTAAELAYEAIQRFLASAKTPVLVEAGSEPIPLTVDSYAVEFGSGRLTVQAWDRSRNLVRRVTAVHRESAGKLELEVERFGKRPGMIELVDLARPKAASVAKRAARHTYAEQFRRSLLRQFPGWQLASLSTEPDLQHSLSPSFPRAFLKQGGAGWAAIGASADNLDVDAALAYGLIWLDYLRRRETRVTLQGLVLFLPEGRQRSTCLRLLALSSSVAQWQVFAYGEGFEDRVDLRNSGNLDTVLPVRRHSLQQGHSDRLDRFRTFNGVQATERAGGGVSFRVKGLEFAYTAGDDLLFGVDTKRKLRGEGMGEVEALARELVRLCSPEAADRHNSLYTRNPELWLEAEVRQNLQKIDAGLQPSPIYGQVPAFAGGERGVIDLLAADFRGRLCVLELKASEDLQLPLQALDYWMRVRWHAGRGDFGRSGYFPGVQLVEEPPRLILAAPALCFHSTTETILRYFPSDLEVVRVGLGIDWQQELKVVLRVEGATRPD